MLSFFDPPYIYHHTTYTMAALHLFVETNEKPAIYGTSMELYYFRKYGPEIKALEPVIANNERNRLKEADPMSDMKAKWEEALA